MPHISDRQMLVRDLDGFFKFLVKTDEDEEDIEEIFSIRCTLEGCRYLNLRNYEKRRNGLSEALWQYSDRDFKQTVRMEKRSFLKLLEIVSVHRMFNKMSYNQYKRFKSKQAPVWIQLMVALIRVGCYGNGVSVGRVGVNCGYSDGSVDNFTNRVFTAILALKPAVIIWPKTEERKEIAKRFKKKGILGGIGVVDGTHCILAQKPKIDGETYWCRKLFYSTNVILICDDKGFIRHYIIGWPGSLYDNTIFETSDLDKKPHKYFSVGQFLLADAGFGLKTHCMTPHRQPFAEIEYNKLFNYYFSSARTIIEHVNGMLKNRFQSLRGIRIQVKTKKDFDAINRHNPFFSPFLMVEASLHPQKEGGRSFLEVLR